MLSGDCILHAGHPGQQAYGPGLTSTDSMLQALSDLTPAQVQRLAAAGQQQQQWPVSRGG